MNHSNNYLKRKRNPDDNYDSIDKKEDGELGLHEHKTRHRERDNYYKQSYRKPSYNNHSPQNKRHHSFDSPTNHKRRPSYDSPPRNYKSNPRYKEESFYERERKPMYYERRDSPSEYRSFESSPRDIRRESRQIPVTSLSRPTTPSTRKRYNFLLCLQKHYFRFIDKNYDKLYRQIKYKVKDITGFKHDFTVSGLEDYVLKIEGNSIASKAHAVKIVCDFIFEEMKRIYNNMSYLKINILVPSSIVGFIIGIEGKNINTIRDMSGARIEVFQHDINDKYRQIELAGSPVDISRAVEKIYKIVNKYYFNNPNPNPNAINKHEIDRFRKRRIVPEDDNNKRRIRLKRVRKEHSPISEQRKESRSDTKKKESRKEEKTDYHHHETSKNNLSISPDFERQIKETNPDDQLIKINIMIPQEKLENQYGLTIEKKIEKLINNEEMNILTFTGTTKQNAVAILHLQKFIADLEKKGLN